MDNLITSVIGFKLKGFKTLVLNDDNTQTTLVGGIRSSVYPNEICQPLHKEVNKKWFTNYNQKLVDKIKDYHNNNI